VATRVPSNGAPAAGCVVLLARDPEAVARCLRALAVALPEGVPLLVGGTDDGRRAVAELWPGEATTLAADGARAWNAAAALHPDADLVLLGDGSELAPGALEDLLAVAAEEPDAATVTPLSNNAAFLSVPRRNLPWPLLPPELTPVDAAARLRGGALAARPRTPTALPHCAVVTAAARQLAGTFDAELEPREALADFCARCTAAGLVHVVADTVFVAHRGAPDGHAAGPWQGAAGERHPELATAVEEASTSRHSALARALLVASVALEPLSVTIDARPLAGGVQGTSVHLLEVLHTLSARDDVRVRALLPASVGAEAARVLERLPGLERIGPEALQDADVARTHVVHRPWQVESAQEMERLDRLGERIVVTHQDLIGYRTPTVFGSVGEWETYRAATRAALALASMVVFFSKATAADAAADDLVAPERSRVVPLGAGGGLVPEAAAVAPEALAGGERPFLLVLGNRFRHKNVRFAVELLGALREQQGWDGDLVIAGAEVLHGSGSADDAAWLLRHPGIAPHVIELGAVAQEEKAWLLHRAAAVVYPSTYEGFGLIPFEAAAAGTPCLVAAVSALRETVPEELALLTPWDAAVSAARCAPVLAAGPERHALVRGLQAAGGRLTWEATAEGLVAAYRDALALPAPPAARLAADLARAEHDYWAVREGVPEGAWELVRPDAPLVDEALARPLADVLRAERGRERLLGALHDLLAAGAPVRRRLRRAGRRLLSR
jgi:glycosyltransferase involved in cell wall biosynthesis